MIFSSYETSETPYFKPFSGKKKRTEIVSTSPFLFCRGDRTRTCGPMVPNDRKALLYRQFRLFLTLSAQNHILFGAFVSVVSVCSGCRCGINCGQKTTSQCWDFQTLQGCFYLQPFSISKFDPQQTKNEFLLKQQLFINSN